MIHRIVIGLLGATLGFLLWFAATSTVEFYDGYEYILSGWAIAGTDLFFFPKNPLFSSWLALLYLPIKTAGWIPQLWMFHLPMLALNLAGLVVIGLWIRRLCPELGWPTVLAVLAFNRLFLHYAVFAMPDLMAGALIGLWLLIDHNHALESRRGTLGRIAALTLCALCRPQSVILPCLAMAVDTRLRPARIARASAIAAVSFFIYWLAASAFLSAGGPFGFRDALTYHAPFLSAFLKRMALDPYYGGFGALALVVNGLVLFSPLGVLLVLLGLSTGISETHVAASLRRNLIGAAGLALFLLAAPSQDGRYLSVLWPFIAFFTCRGILRIRQRHVRWEPAALIGLLLFASPEFAQFTQPFYRSDPAGRAARQIAEWTPRDREIVFLTPMAALFPPNHAFAGFDGAYNVHHWGLATFMFHSGRRATFYPHPVTFTKRGPPLPDEIPSTPEGATLVVPAPAIRYERDLPSQMEPIHALRRTDSGYEILDVKIE